MDEKPMCKDCAYYTETDPERQLGWCGLWAGRAEGWLNCPYLIFKKAVNADGNG